MFGAFIGDSCGSANEFNKKIETDEKMDIIMTMPGEGPWDLDPGQITDDSELALCLMQGIIKGNT